MDTEQESDDPQDRIEDAREGEVEGVPMDEEQLLTLCVQEKNAAISYAQSELDPSRRQAMRDYMQEPMGNEEEGHSQFVSSEVLEAIEWIKPGLLKIFTGSDNVVEFEPTHEDDVDGAQQATDSCNYVFYKQNSGFLVLHTAIQDMLMFRNCAVMWRKGRKRRVEHRNFQGITEDELAYTLSQFEQQYEKVEVVNCTRTETATPNGSISTVDCRIRLTSTVDRIYVEPFSPDDLMISATHNSPMLGDAAYVGRRMRVTLSDVREMGFDVEPEDMVTDRSASELRRLVDSQQTALYRDRQIAAQADPSQTEGDLYYEFIEVDFDGDGIAERRLVIRLPRKILYNEPVDQVQIATSSPILRSHRWDGLSMADLVSSLQGLGTELIRQMLDSLYLANNPRTTVLTQRDGRMEANIDDLLDSRPGGVVRQFVPNAIGQLNTPWVGQQAFPMLEQLQVMRERKTGITSYNQGLDANSLNKTATGITQILSQANQRMELIARIIAETLVKPIMLGILKLLTEGGMQPLAFRLNGKFVQYDPNEWRDEYDMTVNVGLGTGNKDQMLGHLQQIAMAQAAAVQGGMLGKLVTQKQLYHTQAKIVENAGFKDVGHFWTDPETLPPQQPGQEKPDPEMIKLQQQAQLDQAKLQNDQQNAQMKLQSAADIERIKQEGETHRHMLTIKANRVAMGMEEDPEEDMRTAEMIQVMAAMQQTQQVIAQAVQLNSEMLARLAQGRKTELIKDSMGRTVGAVSVPVPVQGAE